MTDEPMTADGLVFEALSLACVALYSLPLGYGVGLLIGHPVLCEVAAKILAGVGVGLLVANAGDEEWR